MVIPSIDLQNASTVQLVGGRDKALDAGDPRPLARRFGLAGEIAVIDLDAALSTGSNAALIKDLLTLAPCRVGGGIRSIDRAVEWLDAGAHRVILGTAAVPEILRELPRERVIAAVDAYHGEVVVKGWREGTGRKLAERIAELRDHVGGFLVTFVEREGRMTGIDMEQVAAVIAAAGPVRVTVAGGIASAAEIGAIDRAGADAQVGMGLYTGKFSLAGALAAPLSSDRPDGLWPTIVCDEGGVALGLAYSNLESLTKAVELQQGVYWSRNRGLWIKGLTSGATQDLLRVTPDCDRDCLRFTVRQRGAGFCHTGSATCFGGLNGLRDLAATLARRKAEAPAGSYTARLFSDPALLRAKLLEEAGELADAVQAQDPAQAAEEAADVLYFALASLASVGGDLSDVERVLDRRRLRVTRRPGNAKPSAPAHSSDAPAPRTLETP